MSKFITLRKGGSKSFDREIVNLDAMESVNIHTEKARAVARETYRGMPLPQAADQRAAVLSRERSGVLRLASGREIPLMDDELILVLEAMGQKPE